MRTISRVAALAHDLCEYASHMDKKRARDVLSGITGGADFVAFGHTITIRVVKGDIDFSIAPLAERAGT